MAGGGRGRGGPGTFTDSRALYARGPPPPPSFLAPDDLAEQMTGAHAPG